MSDNLYDKKLISILNDIQLDSASGPIQFETMYEYFELIKELNANLQINDHPAENNTHA